MRRLAVGVVVVLVLGGVVQMSAEMARADHGAILNDDLSPLPESIPGDTDGDGDVDFADFNNLANNYTGLGGSGKGLGDGDFDGDGDVDFADFNSLANNYTGALTSDPEPPAHQPEPSTFIIWSLLGALGVAVSWWRRRRQT